MEKKLLTPEAARNVFYNGEEAHDFLTKGSTRIISTGSMDFANPNAQALTNGAVSNGATLLMAGVKYDYAQEAEKMIKSSNKELMTGKVLSHGEMIDYSAWGEKMVEKAEQQIENNNRAMQIHKESHFTR